jgi:hypothetical protein
MSDHQNPAPWSPYDLHTEEHDAILKSSQAIEIACTRIRELAHVLHYDGLLPVPDVQWLINAAYCALAGAKDLAWQVEYNERVRQLASQNIVSLASTLVDLPPNEHIELPDWLLALEQREE